MPNASNSTSFISLDRVRKVFEPSGDHALKGVTFSVDKGEFVCIVGPSGCGKSTALKIIAGLEQETGGTVDRPESLSMVFQSVALFPWLTVFENVALGLRTMRLSEATVQKRASTFIDMLGLTDLVTKFPRELSGGQRQRVGIARALAIKPDVLLLDEPFSALDPKTTHELHLELLRIWTISKLTIVMVSHSIDEAVSLANRVILMKDGAVKKIFPIDISRPRHEQGKEFLDDVMHIRKAFFA